MIKLRHYLLLLDARFVPRHDDELELEVNDPLLVEVQGEDYWYEAYNMRTGARGIFPAFYATEITKDAEHFKEGKLQRTASSFLWCFKWPASGLAGGMAVMLISLRSVVMAFIFTAGKGSLYSNGLAEDRYFYIYGKLFLVLASSCALLVLNSRDSI